MVLEGGDVRLLQESNTYGDDFRSNEGGDFRLFEEANVGTDPFLGSGIRPEPPEMKLNAASDTTIRQTEGNPDTGNADPVIDPSGVENWWNENTPDPPEVPGGDIPALLKAIAVIIGLGILVQLFAPAIEAAGSSAGG